MRIGIIGSGYVGLVAGACFAEIGHNVICVDNDPLKVAALQRGECLIHEEFLPELLARHAGSRLVFTSSLAEAVRKSSLIFIAVGTPPCENGEADVSFLEGVCRDIARQIDEPKVVVVKSTVPVGTNQWIRRVLLRHGVPRDKFEVASNPEFLREGSGVVDFLYPDRIVIGSDSLRAIELLREAYRPLTQGTYKREKNAIPHPDDAPGSFPLVVVSPASAEMIKHSCNAFLAMKVSFINAIANICEAQGADISELVRGMGLDHRIGTQFLKAGIGYGGSCLPKDLHALRAVANECGYDFRLLDEVMRINEEQRRTFVRKVRHALWTLKGKRLAVLGLSFKGGTDDVRESPAIALIRMLLREGCEIVASDPAAIERARDEFTPADCISFAETAYDAAVDADALLVLTDWEEYASLDFARLRAVMRHPIVIDGRNLYEPEQMEKNGFSYVSVGRRPVMGVPADARTTSEAA